jgi:hypothetical protein
MTFFNRQSTQLQLLKQLLHWNNQQSAVGSRQSAVGSRQSAVKKTIDNKAQ